VSDATPAAAPPDGAPQLPEEKLPPVTPLAMLSLALIVAGGIYLASHLPEHVPIGPAAGLLIASGVVLAVNVGLLARAKTFNWPLFVSVAKWAFLAYAIIAGLIGYVFVKDGTRGAELVVLGCSLAVFAIHVPLLIGFTVARFDPLDEPGAESA
jgi:hypothetical protein